MTNRRHRGCHDRDWDLAAVGQAFTVADLDRMPDDGRRYELVDGVLPAYWPQCSIS